MEMQYFRLPSGAVQRVKKASQSLPPAGGKKSEIIFSRDMRVRENTSQAESVEFVRRRHTNYARSRLQVLCRKTLRVFGQSPQRRTGFRPALFVFVSLRADPCGTPHRHPGG